MGYSNCAQPAAQYLEFAKSNRRAGWDSIATVPLVDYVTADKDGPVDEKDKAPSKRWVRSLPQKPTAYAATPDLRDGVVYEDEFVSYMVQKLGKASDGGIKFYALDNEPALWPSTHPRVHPEKTTYAEMVDANHRDRRGDHQDRSVGAGHRRHDVRLVGVHDACQDAPDAKAENAKLAGGSGTYVDFLLASMKRAEEQHHRRLMHLLDFHWYPEARGAARITDKDVSPKTIDARLQAPRSLWDPTYVEKSWIAATWGKPIRLFRWLQERVDANYPGHRSSP